MSHLFEHMTQKKKKTCHKAFHRALPLLLWIFFFLSLTNKRDPKQEEDIVSPGENPIPSAAAQRLFVVFPLISIEITATNTEGDESPSPGPYRRNVLTKKVRNSL